MIVINLVVLITLQLIFVLLLIYIIHVLINEIKMLNIEKRISNYSLDSQDEQSIPFFEVILKSIWNLIRKLNNLWKKSVILEKYSKKYDKYIPYNELKYRTKYDYLSIKFLISLLFALFYIVSSLLQNIFDIYILLLVSIISYFILDVYLKFEYKLRNKQIENDLLNAVIIMNNAFKSGMNIMQAVDIVKNELTGPIQDEFKKISIDISYGLSLETVFERFYNRVGIEDVKYITSSLSLINKTGGNIVRVFNAIEKNFYDKKKIKDEMNALTSSSLFMFRMLVFMPLVLILIIYILNNDYFLPFFTTVIGRLMLVLILILYTLYIVVIKRVLKVKL